MKTDEHSSKYALIKKASSNIFVAVAVAAVIVSFSIVTIKFLLDLRSFNSNVQGEQSETIEILEANIQKYNQLAEDYVAFESADKIIAKQGNRGNTTTVFDALPSKYDYPAIVTAVEGIAKASNVQLIGINGKDGGQGAILSDPDPSPIGIDFGATVRGNYKSIQRFLTNLKRTIRPYQVATMRFSGSDDNLRLSVEMTTYYQPSIDVTEDVYRSVSQ